MAEDLSVKGLQVKDDVRYDPYERTNVRERVYSFYLGKHGPFTERVPLANFDDQEFQKRVDKLRLHLSMPVR